MLLLYNDIHIGSFFFNTLLNLGRLLLYDNNEIMIVLRHRVITFKEIRRVIGIILILVIIFWVAFYNRVSIDKYHADITLDEAGNMSVIEQWDMTYKEGLLSFIGISSDPMRVRFRDIGFDKYAPDYNFPMKSSNIASFDESSADVTVLKDGVDVTDHVRIGYSFNNDFDELGYRIECEPQSDQCESLFIDTTSIGGLVGDLTFIYKYTILGAVTQYSDTSELNWVLLSYAEAKIKNGSVSITLPAQAIDETDLFIWGHGLANGIVSIESSSLAKLTFENMKKDDFLEFRLLTPNALFPDVEPINVFNTPDINLSLIYNYEDNLVQQTNESITAAIMMLIGSGIISLFMIIFLYLYDKRFFRIFKTEDFGDYLRELPSNHSPAEIGYLYRFKKTKTEDITATLLDLINRDYIEILDSKINLISEKVAYELLLNETKSHEDLKAHEKHLIEWFFKTIGNGVKVNTKQIEDYGAYKIDRARTYLGDSVKFTNLVFSECAKQDFFDQNIDSRKTKAKILIALPIFVAIVISILAQVFWVNVFAQIAILALTSVGYVYFVSTRKRRSENGQILFNKWYAFKHFLEDFGSFDDDPIPSIVVWEHYLAYATTFGIADKVMEQLKVKIGQEKISLENSRIIHSMDSFDSRSYHLYKRFNNTFHNARSNTNYRMTQALTHSSVSSRSNTIRGVGSRSSAFSSRPSSFGRGSGSSGRSSSGRSGGFSGGSSRGGGRGGGRSR